MHKFRRKHLKLYGGTEVPLLLIGKEIYTSYVSSAIGTKKGIPATMATCMQGYALFLQGQDYDFKSSKSHANCDAVLTK